MIAVALCLTGSSVTNLYFARTLADDTVDVSSDQYWSFAPPQSPALPEVQNRYWPKNAIDQFVLSRLEKKRLSPAPEADRNTLIRRVSLDLIGLPPTMPFWRTAPQLPTNELSSDYLPLHATSSVLTMPAFAKELDRLGFSTTIVMGEGDPEKKTEDVLSGITH